MTLIDSHCHLNFPEYKDNYESIIADCLKKEIGLINIGTSLKTSSEVLNLANQYPSDPVYAAIGLYPAHLSNTEYDAHEKELKDPDNFFNPKFYQKLIDADKNNVETQNLASRKIIAVGEIGLEYSHVPEGRNLSEIKNLQKQGFIDQLNFAQKNILPVILHARGSKENHNDAYEEMLELLKLQITDYGLQITGVLHCFGSTMEIAQKFLDLGFYIGFTGIITFKNKSVDNLRQVVKMVPLEKILIETDAPYLTPEPHRGEINQPDFVEFVAQKIAEIKNITYEEVCAQTTANTIKLFSLSHA